MAVRTLKSEEAISACCLHTKPRVSRTAAYVDGGQLHYAQNVNDNYIVLFNITVHFIMSSIKLTNEYTFGGK
jgi:hypothetical protein